MPFWIKKIFNDPVFKNKLAKRWNESKQNVFSLSGMLTNIDQNAQIIKQARARNFIQWPIIGAYQWPEYFVGQTYEEEILYLKEWIVRRFNWVDANLSANYSDVEWLSVDFSKIAIEPSVTVKLPMSLFVDSFKNISTFEFRSTDTNINFRLESDSVEITINKQGDYTFKGVAKNNNEIVSISPEYKISLPTDIRHDFKVVQKFDLYQNYPNPFNPVTSIRYDLPKQTNVFISYSWSLKEHEKKVLELAESLVGNGIEVVLDKWELPEGDDKFKFMERSVNDKSIDKIIIISDKKYAEKADNRKGGVGTETQIISPKLYEQFKKEEQKSRFVALAFENNENDEPYLPTYFKNRIYIDFNSEELRNENFEQLIRWIYNKPIFIKPELGKPPFYITSEDHISLNTQAKLKAYNNALHSNIKSAKGALNDHLETFSINLGKFRMEFESPDNYYEKVIENVKQFLPYRNEFVEVTISALKYLDEETIAEAFHKFFEDILSYKIIFNDTKFKDRMEFDNYQFIINELFIYFIAAVLKQNRFHLFDIFLSKEY